MLESNNPNYQFSSPLARQLCHDAVRVASKKTYCHLTPQDQAISIRNTNIELLQSHIPKMRNDADIRRAHATIAQLQRLNVIDQQQVLL